MVSTFTPNIQLEEPARGDQVGTWDTPVNNNATLLDLVCGGFTVIGVNNTNVTLSAAQYQCRTIAFQSTLTGNVTITFPTSFKKDYNILHQATGSSAFLITLATTVAGSAVVALPPSEGCQILNTGGGIEFLNLGPPVGTIVDFATVSFPPWINACSLPPYIPCDGSTFSSAAFPYLANLLGGNATPDFRGRYPAYHNLGSGRLTTGGAGVDGNTLFGTGGFNGVTLLTSQMPQHTHGVNDPGHTHGTNANSGPSTTGGGGFSISAAVQATINSAVTGISIQSNGGGGSFQNSPPTIIAGMRAIRAG